MAFLALLERLSPEQRAGGRLVGVLALDVAGNQVQAVSALVNPEKLDHLGLPIADLAALLRPRP